MRKLFAALLVAAGIVGAVAVSPAQAAVTWANQAIRTDTTYVDNCDGTTGTIRVKLRFQISQGESPQRARLDPAVDIEIYNNSKLALVMDERYQVGGGIFWERLATNSVASEYQYGGEGHVYGVGSGDTKTYSVDNPVRWVRRDGVGDSDPSPYGTPLSLNGYPAVEIFGTMDNNVDQAGNCGTFNTEIGYLPV